MNLLTFARRGESAATGVFLKGESGGEGEIGGMGDMEQLVLTDSTSSLETQESMY